MTPLNVSTHVEMTLNMFQYRAVVNLTVNNIKVSNRTNMSILSEKADFFSRTSCKLLNKKEKYYARNTIQKPGIFL